MVSILVKFSKPVTYIYMYIVIDCLKNLAKGGHLLQGFKSGAGAAGATAGCAARLSAMTSVGVQVDTGTATNIQ